MKKMRKLFFTNTIMMSLFAIFSFLYPFYRMYKLYNTGITSAELLFNNVKTVLFGCWFVTAIAALFAAMFMAFYFKSANIEDDEQMSYRLIAFDMDGTLLNQQKEILPESIEAIKTAVKNGKTVILSTGRGIKEVEKYFPYLPDVRYIICLSGGMIIDRFTGQFIYRRDLEDDDVKEILKVSKTEKCMLHFLNEESIITHDDYDHICDFQMAEFKSMYKDTATLVDDIYDYYQTNKPLITKLNLYLPDTECRKRYLERLSHLNIELAFSNSTALECSSIGVTKGQGLTKLCEYLEIPLNETIAVGDSGNDTDMLKTAGLSIAMGNADSTIKDLCTVTVSDNEHNGCAEAIYNYLLK